MNMMEGLGETEGEGEMEREGEGWEKAAEVEVMEGEAMAGEEEEKAGLDTRQSTGYSLKRGTFRYLCPGRQS